MKLTVVPGQPMPENESARHWSLLNTIRAAREAFDPGSMIALFAPDAVYEAQTVLTPLEGHDEIARYLEGRFAFIAKMVGERDTGRLVPGVVDLPEASNHPCLIFEADGERQALWALKLTEDGRIVRMDILTVAPQPSTAREVERGNGC